MTATRTDRDRMLTIREVAELTGCSDRTVAEWLAKRWLASVKIGRLRRIRQSDFEAFVAARLER